MTRGLTRLAAELSGATAPGNDTRCWMEPGVVKAVVSGYSDDTTITVTWRNTDIPCAYLGDYTPVAGDVVALLIQPPSVLALGKIIGPDTSTGE